VTQHAFPLQVIYPVTNCGALSARFAASERTALAASTRQAIALMRWAHKFGPAENVQRAERFLLERMRLMLTVRALMSWLIMH
jgi:hypothetical protein